MDGWVLGEQSGLSIGPETIAEVLAVQRQRFVTHLRGLDTLGWSAATRCSAWSTHHVARHMMDTARINAARLAGRPPVFPTDGPFDPARTPDVWLCESADQSPKDTLAALEAAVADEAHSFQARIRAGGSQLMPGPSGRQVHWSNVPLHILWDAWLHERDVLLAVGIGPESMVEELRLVAMYGLQVAAIPPLLVDSPIDTTIALGEPDCRYRILISGNEIVVAAEEAGDAELRGELCTVLDALMGRGRLLSEALVGNDEAIEKLSWLSAFMAAE